jgi:hypothetical protein
VSGKVPIARATSDTGDFTNGIFGFQQNTNQNTAYGFECLAPPSGDPFVVSTRNTAYGYQAGAVIFGGGSNTVVGYRAGVTMSSGQFNVCVGVEAGSTIISGDGNVCVGRLARPSNTSFDDTIALGRSATPNASGQLALGINTLLDDTAPAATVTGVVLPAQPETLLQVRIGTTTYVIPLYNVGP